VGRITESERVSHERHRRFEVPGGSDVALRVLRRTGKTRASRQHHSEEAMGELIDKTKGKIKQATGALTGSRKLESAGRVDTAKGNAKGAFEDVKQAVKGGPKK
jgi:uncharacterized protein YjbJ (UPF0337 family)